MKYLKNIFTVILLFNFTVSFSQIKSEKITPPAEGKSVIYFMRTAGYAGLMNFRYFDGEEYLGKFGGKSYMRYECDPGKKNFWLKAENVAVLEADLEPNKVYIVLTNPRAFAVMSVAAKFELVDYNNKRHVKRINKLLKKKQPKTFTKAELDKHLAKMENTHKKAYQRVREKIADGETTILKADDYLKM